MKALLDIVARHRSGQAVGISSICSAHPVVLDAALRHGRDSGQSVLIEATSNQVNQFGGYTGMRPVDFHAFVMDRADQAGLPRERVLLGGDHLGPNCWQGESAGVAMVKSETLIDDYVTAGFRKIHLDCSMSCADDPQVLSDAEVAARAARLAAVAERAWRRSGGEAPVYIVGTEVPVPGGAKEELDGLQVTRPEAMAATVEAHRSAFAERGLDEAWQRVVGLVVQPGVEFDHHDVVDYQPDKARALSAALEAFPGLVYEAHSTDYQTPAALAALVRGHFAILKVGPGVTYALRETLWALSFIEDELVADAQRSQLRRVVLEVMRAEPKYWSKYYTDESRLALDLQYSLSDRVRYYWGHPRIRETCDRLLRNLDGLAQKGALPLALLSQYLPRQHDEIRAGRLVNSAGEILRAGVTYVVRQYAEACMQI
ncbi:D-tagatose-bisphosphate aldolase, class II, non-catalytic subunit [Dyella flava]|uniref:D-tagatose-bisphosphate aldolase, class II, non-catalytic subunit n=1 Tax=Dyella flava TaxID=1920170 RepID=A0ABS2JYL1_9GAMM|nr:D-tagatose-bisphosphate aldolase, class II, non-catalytic subunit [Dyella flava]MBM7124087.1 D-tagatose-bisphosphate aldolase, class II, non-catalytic subunit [Dyella flava]GLQ52741.1 D-tagatose-1,6-bisphosphate aldolase subunit KbaZ [Dyella flava]